MKLGVGLSCWGYWRLPLSKWYSEILRKKEHKEEDSFGVGRDAEENGGAGACF